MAIPDFLGQFQSSLRTGQQLGRGYSDAQARSQLRQLQMQQMQLQNQQMQQENLRKDMLQNLILLSSLSEEEGKQVIPQIIDKYQGNESVLAAMRDLYGSTGKDYIKKTLTGVSAFSGKPLGVEQKTPKTAAMQEYDLAKEQGYEGSFLDFKNDLKGKQSGTIGKPIKGDDGRWYIAMNTPEGVKTQLLDTGEKLESEEMEKAVSVDEALDILDKAKETQSKTGGFALTMKEGLDLVDDLATKGYDPSNAAWINKYLGGTSIGNLVLNEDDQIFLGAVEQIINAIARRETGAAITEFERKDFFNRYFPQPGDKKKRLKQKRDALQRQFNAIRGQSGRVYDALRVVGGIDKAQQVKAPQIDNLSLQDLQSMSDEELRKLASGQ